MNFKGSIENLFNKSQNNEEDLAVIFKNCMEEKGSIVYLPVGIASGKLDEESLSFVSGDLTFNHLIKGPKEYGFAFSKTLTETVRNNKFIPKIIQEKLMLRSLSNFNYIYTKDQHKNPLVGVQSLDDNSDIDILYEDELLNYYIKNFPTAKEIIALLKKASGKLNLDIKEISTALDNTYSNKKQSKQILTAIWKHYLSNTSYNIFVNGSDISPKREIIKSICDKANIPCYYVSTIENYEITDMENMLKSLIHQCGNNVELAENSILVIDDINKLALTSMSDDSFANAQINLAKILRGETFELRYSKVKKVNFDTSKMMIIGMGNFEDDEIEDIKIGGFSPKANIRKDKKAKYKPGMLEGLFDNFKMIIQMDEPNLQDYQNYLSKREKAGIINNIDFFGNLDIKLTISDEVISNLANLAYKNKMSLNDLSDFIENMLSIASFEIAKNPAEYKELVITPDTITDNKAYTLIKRKTTKV